MFAAVRNAGNPYGVESHPCTFHVLQGVSENSIEETQGTIIPARGDASNEAGRLGAAQLISMNLLKVRRHPSLSRHRKIEVYEAKQSGGRWRVDIWDFTVVVQR
eukprot:4037811-Pyramimonas_sp.AAC.1